MENTNNYKDKTILVIGTGFLGRTVVNKLQSHGCNVVYTHNTNPYFDKSIKFDFVSDKINEIVDLGSIDSIVLTMKIESAISPKELVKSASEFLNQIKNNRLVYISSDAVFDGRKGMYSEQDKPNPITEYGKNKKLFEDIIQERSNNYCIIRPSYIYGRSLGEIDRRLQKTINMINGGEKVEVFGDMYKSPIDVNQLAEIVAQEAMSQFVGILHAGGERVSVYSFKKQALEALDLSTVNLVETMIPSNYSLEMLKDTSLANTLMRKNTGINPCTIEKSYKPTPIK